MMKNLLFSLTACVFTVFNAGAQEIICIESIFDKPAIIKLTSAGTETGRLDLDPGSLPQAVAVNNSTGTLFWTELMFSEARIQSTAADLSAVSAVDTAHSALRGIAVDEGAEMLYWISTNLRTGPAIGRTPLSGGGTGEILLQFEPNGTNTPRAVAVDSDAGIIYWTDYGAGTIRKAKMHDSIPAAEDVVTGLSGPVGLAIDVDGGGLYWTEMIGGTVKRSALDGSGIDTLVTGLTRPQFIAIDTAGQLLFWTGIGDPGIWSSGYDGTDMQKLPVSVSAPAGIAVMDLPTPVSRDRVAGNFVLENPAFSGSFMYINFQLPDKAKVSARLYSFRGTVIREAAEAPFGPGHHSLRFNLSDTGPGVYIIRFKAGDNIRTVRVAVPQI